MLKNSIIDTIEKLFRYFIPGFIFIILFGLSCPVTFGKVLGFIDKFKFLSYLFIPILLPCIGMVIYGLHRVWMWGLLDWVLYLFNLNAVSNFYNNEKGKNKKSEKIWQYSSSLAEFFKTRHSQPEESKNLSDYLFYRWSIHHYVLILIELFPVFFFIKESGSKFDNYCWLNFWIPWSALFCLIWVGTLIMFATEKYLYFPKEESSRKRRITA